MVLSFLCCLFWVGFVLFCFVFFSFYQGIPSKYQLNVNRKNREFGDPHTTSNSFYKKIVWVSLKTLGLLQPPTVKKIIILANPGKEENLISRVDTF